MASTFESIEKEIASGQLKPVYLLKGEEIYYIKLLTEKFEKEVLAPEEADFNLSVFYGKDASMDSVILSAKQYPVMAKRRVVILKEAQTMDKRELSKVEPYVLKPTSTTVLVIENAAGDFPQALATKIGKVGTVFESKKLKEDKIVSWIDVFAKKQGFTIEPQASALVIDYLGDDLMKIANELSKLMIDLTEARHITLADVSSHIGISKKYNVFELQRAIGKLDYDKINKCVDHIAQNPKENPLPVIFANLFAYFSKLLVAAQCRGMSDSETASKIKVSPYFVRDYTVAAQRYPTEKLIQNISIIRQYELRSKGVDYSPLSSEGDLLKEFVFRLTH